LRRLLKVVPRSVLGRVLAVVAITAVVGLTVNLIVYQGSSSFSVREEEAYRTSEHVVIVARLLEEEVPERRARVVAAASTEHFKLSWNTEPLEDQADSPLLQRMRAQMLQWEPSLQGKDLRLRLIEADDETEVLGSLRLNDGSWLEFRAADLIGSWPIGLREVAIASLPMLALVLIAFLALRTTLRPLGLLADAVARVGYDAAVLLPEQGIPELRRLIRAYNEMHGRIVAMMKARTEALAAVGHDLRTPLSRMRLRVDELAEDSNREALIGDMQEMELMLDSLLTYFRGDDHAEKRRLVDVAVLVTTVVDDLQDRGFDIRYTGPSHCDATLRPVEFKRALSNLANNACQYGNQCTVRLAESSDAIHIRFLDDGPGIPEEDLGRVLEPFQRLDPARQRNTSGVGLGIPIAVRVIAEAGGVLTLSNRKEGGLCAEIRLPRERVAA
jgi:two-component system, OmpR family, osmolarity sensor histidine kinase EnvZ